MRCLVRVLVDPGGALIRASNRSAIFRVVFLSAKDAKLDPVRIRSCCRLSRPLQTKRVFVSAKYGVFAESPGRPWRCASWRNKPGAEDQVRVKIGQRRKAGPPIHAHFYHVISISCVVFGASRI